MELVIPSLDRLPSCVAASRKVIEANGGAGIEHFDKPAAFGGKASLRFRITLQEE